MGPSSARSGRSAHRGPSGLLEQGPEPRAPANAIQDVRGVDELSHAADVLRPREHDRRRDALAQGRGDPVRVRHEVRTVVERGDDGFEGLRELQRVVHPDDASVGVRQVSLPLLPVPGVAADFEPVMPQ